MPSRAPALRLCLGLLTWALITPIMAAEDDDQIGFRGLAEEMTAAEFFRAGLEGLSPEQLAALDAWLRERMAAGKPAQTGADTAATARLTAPQAATVPAAPAAAAKTEAEQAARRAEAEAAAAIAAAEAAEAEARQQAAEARARQIAAQQAAAEDAKRAQRLAEQEALIDEPFQDGRWVGPKPDRVSARIDGPFQGWEGKTLFSLDNGQIWKQRQKGRYYHDAASPQVLITRNALGFFVMEIVPTGKRIGVKRVR